MTVKPGWARKRPTPARPPPHTAAESGSALAPNERPLWNLNRDDQRLLAITFAGGLGSLVLAACLLAGAIAIARRVTRTPGWVTPLALVTALEVAVAAFFWFMYWFVRWNAHRRSRRPPRLLILYVRIWIVIILLVVAFFVTVWIGVAAGVK
jgi:Kef-type K+ transport system membrane component KefB